MKRNTLASRRPDPFIRGNGVGAMGHVGALNSSVAARGSGGHAPLISDDLRLHDLDLELALLKRKREMIEQQQQVLVNERYNRPSPFEYNQPTSSFNRQYDQPKLNTPRNFSQFYEPDFNSFNRQQGVKRQANDVGWSSNLPPKRFGGFQKDKPKNSGNRFSQPRRPPPQQRSESSFRTKQPSASASQPIPLMGKSWPKPSLKARKNFNPTKVTKPKAESAPNKLNSYSQPQRKNLIDQASALVKKNEQDMVYHPDKPMSRQVTGRLELALGTILKKVKNADGGTASLGVHAIRALKQGIRERIRKAMVGKVVGSSVEIVNTYRAMYPKDTDKELINDAMKAEKIKVKPLVKYNPAENPEKYFKANMNKLLNNKLKEMFEKLQELYEEKQPKPLSKVINEIWNEEKAKLEAIPEENSDESTPAEKSDVTAEKDTVTDEQMNDSKEGQNDSQTKDEDITTNNEVEPKLNDSAETNEESKQNETADEEAKGDISENQADDAGSNWDTSEGRRANYYNRLIGILLHHRLPLMLPKFKEQIIQLLNIDEEYKQIKAAIIMQTNQKAEAYQSQLLEQTNDSEPKANGETSTAETEAQPAATGPRILPYYVKIFGRPYLPRRKLMQAFLDQFHPSSIKKHREVHNLLFVGFNNKEDFENILKANHIMIGNSTIEIKVSEKIKEKIEEKDADNSKDVTVVEDSETDKSSDPITSELDEQINDLLTSIREEEEKNTVNMDPVSEALDTIEKDNQREKDDIAKKQSMADEIEKNKKNEEPKEDEEPKENEDSQENEVAKPAEVEAAKNEEKASGRATPTRSSSRLATATPSTIRTRRASRLAQNN